MDKATVNERIALYGAYTLTASELLSTLTGIPLESLQKYIKEYGLKGLIKNIDLLLITKAQRNKLHLVFEVSRKISASYITETEKIDSSTVASEYFKELLSTLPVEQFNIALLDAQNKLIKTIVSSKGSTREAPVYPIEIVKMAVLSNATSVILAHNHPGGSINPSNSDIEVTNRIKEALKTVAIKVIDHIIVCGDHTVSMAERGLV